MLVPAARCIQLVRLFKAPLSYLNNAIIRLIGQSSYVKEAMKNHRKWESRFHQGPKA